MSVIDESRRRIVTTGVGSLPRRHSLSDLLLARMTKQPFDPKALARETTEAVAEVVHKQIELGVDIVSDGEQSKTSFQHYIADRLTGLEPIAPKAGRAPHAREHGVPQLSTKTARIPARSRRGSPAPGRSNMSARNSSPRTSPISKPR